MGGIDKFNRGLSNAFLALCQEGACRKVLDSCRELGLDLRLRDDYINAYHDGRSVVKLSPSRRSPRIDVHHKYLTDELLAQAAGKNEYRRLNLDASVAAAFSEALPEVLKLAAAHSGAEELIERRFLAENAGGGALESIDRQVQLPGTKGRMDVVGVMREPHQFVVVEIKAGGDNSIQRAPQQMHAYLELLNPVGAGLQSDVARAYRTVARQMSELGIPGPSPRMFRPGMPVAGLIVVYKHNPESELVARAREAAKGLDREMGLWLPDDGLAVPAVGDWEMLGGAG